MLAETVSDPRRANWLTISTSEDLSWPEENGTNRPSWELEAEILRLTTRLMMQERELRQAKVQLKSQARSEEQRLATWRQKMLEKEEQLQRLLVQKDSEMQSIVSQLLLFEAELRQEQLRIEGLLKEKDSTIQKQQQEIKRLQSLVSVSRIDSSSSAHHSVEGAIVENTSSVKSNDSSRRNIPVIEDCKKTMVSAGKNARLALERRSSAPVDREVVTVSSDAKATDVAVKKIKDGLVRIRGIHDLTNVRSRCEKEQGPDARLESCFVLEKRRAPHKTPQKMKDLKAKRIHLQQRSDFCNQVIL